MVVPTLAELFGEDELQEDPNTLPTISLPSSLLVLASEVLDLGIQAALASPIVIPTLPAPPLSPSLAPITVPPEMMPLSPM